MHHLVERSCGNVTNFCKLALMPSVRAIVGGALKNVYVMMVSLERYFYKIWCIFETDERLIR